MTDSLAPKDEAVAKEPRGARRKRETHAKLIQAAFQLMAHVGMEGVTINEITEAADVGFGSFYNYFESKQAIYKAVIETLFEDFGNWIDHLVAGDSDPARITSISVCHTLLRAESEPLWGKFLIREALSMRSLDLGLGRRLFRDIRSGIEAQRFQSADPFMTYVSVRGTVVMSIAAATNSVERPQLAIRDLPQRSAATVLRMLGLDPCEADEIAHRPLPH